MDDAPAPNPPPRAVEAIREPEKRKPLASLGHDYKGFVSGVFSGVAKLTGKFFPRTPRQESS
jgi:hypothetical protein